MITLFSYRLYWVVSIKWSFTSWLDFEEVAYRLKIRDEIVEKRESYLSDIYSQNVLQKAVMASKLHQKCKVHVIVWHVHKIMMIPITRNHQEGEEHAKRSSVSSSVRWLIKGTVLNTREVP